jgi:hypothetical protein
MSTTAVAAAGPPRAAGWSRLAGVLRQPPYPWLWTALTAVVATAMTIARRPDSIFHAQFWAEDGQVWFGEAYNWGWLPSTFTPHTGYFQTISRLTADISLVFDFTYAPLIFNASALLIQVLPAVFFVTPRFRRVVPDFRVRLLLALLYIAIPNSYELDANITNSMTHLGLLAALIVLADPSPRPGWRMFDVSWVILAGLSGPFVIALAPIAVLRWFTDRVSRWRLVLMGLVLACAATQAGAVLLTGANTRPHPPLGATPHGFMAIIAGNVFAGAVVGLFNYTQMFTQAWWEPHSLALRLAFAAGVLVVIYAAVRGPIELRLYSLFAWLVLFASMLTPVLTLTGDQWPLLAHPGAGNRYYLLPMLSLVASIVWMVFRARPWVLRLPAAAVLLTMVVVAIPADWTYPTYADMEPERYARIFNQTAPGGRVEIPINPPGWRIAVTKK